MGDARYALRTLAKSPGFTALAVATLALGIGASTAIFSVLDAVVLKPLPFPQADRLLVVWPRAGTAALGESSISPPEYADIVARQKVFEGVAALRDRAVNLTGGGRGRTPPGVRGHAEPLTRAAYPAGPRTRLHRRGGAQGRAARGHPRQRPVAPALRGGPGDRE